MADQLETLFAELHTQAVRTIESPGVEAAHRTVRRRRRARSIAATATLTIVAGGVVLAVIPPSRQTDLVGPADTMAVERAVEPFAAFAIAEHTGRAGKSEAPTVISLANITLGDYAIAFACAPRGMLVVTLDGARISETPCAPSPSAVTVDSLTTMGPVRLELSGAARPFFALAFMPQNAMYQAQQERAARQAEDAERETARMAEFSRRQDAKRASEPATTAPSTAPS